MVWVGLSVICLYTADDVRESSSRPGKLVISFFHNHELGALKSPMRSEQIGNSSFMSLRHVSTWNFEIHRDSGLETINTC